MCDLSRNDIIFDTIQSRWLIIHNRTNKNQTIWSSQLTETEKNSRTIIQVDIQYEKQQH